MRIALAGPISTAQLGGATALDLRGLPPGAGASPLAPLTAGLLAAGHEVHVVTLGALLDEPLMVSRGALTISWVPVRAAPRYRARARSRDLFAREIAFLRASLAETGADIVHAHWTYEYAEAAIQSGLPNLVTMHDLGWHNLRQFRNAYRLMRLVMKYRTMPRVRHLSVVAPFMARQARLYGYFRAIDVVPNGVDVAEHGGAEARALSLARPILVAVGDRGPIKNIRAALAAFQLIRARRPTAELHLFGHGLDADFVGAADGVTAHGAVDHPELMAFLAARATLLLHPSRLECCPAIVIEAKARGIPVIGGSRSGGVGFVVGVDRGGVHVDITRPDAIAGTAIALLDDRGRYLATARAAHRDAVERFARSWMTSRYQAIYERILSAG